VTGKREMAKKPVDIACEIAYSEHGWNKRENLRRFAQAYIS
jgi:hypothetical protein